MIFKKNTFDHGNLRYQGKPMVYSPLIRPAIYWGKRGIGGGTLDSHDIGDQKSDKACRFLCILFG